MIGGLQILKNVLSSVVDRNALCVDADDWILRGQSLNDQNSYQYKHQNLEHFNYKPQRLNMKIQTNKKQRYIKQYQSDLQLNHQIFILHSNNIDQLNYLVDQQSKIEFIIILIKAMRSRQLLKPKKRQKIFRNQLFQQNNTFSIIPYHFQPENTYFIDHSKGKMYSSCDRKAFKASDKSKNEKRNRSERKLIFFQQAVRKSQTNQLPVKVNTATKNKAYFSNQMKSPQFSSASNVLQNTHQRQNILQQQNTLQQQKYQNIPQTNIYSVVLHLCNLKMKTNTSQQSNASQSKQNKVMKPEDYFNFLKKTKKKRYQKMHEMKHISKTFNQRLSKVPFFNSASSNKKPKEQQYVYHI